MANDEHSIIIVILEFIFDGKYDGNNDDADYNVLQLNDQTAAKG